MQFSVFYVPLQSMEDVPCFQGGSVVGHGGA